MITDNPRDYTLRIVKSLLVQAHIVGIKSDDLVEFLATQIQSMRMRPPNFQKDGRMWLMRGFYPGSTLFFKLSVSDNGSRLHAKASPLVIKSGKYGMGQWDATLLLNGNDINNSIQDKMENIFLDADHAIDPLIKDKIKMPRCMSPKGMRIFRYKKPTKRGKNEANKK